MNIKIKQLEIMTKGQKLEYIGKGFIGYHPHYNEMLFIKEDGIDYLVYYDGGTIRGNMLVRPSEVKIID